MKIALGSDHTGFSARKKIRKMLRSLDVGYVDFGCASEDAADYPEMAYPVARAVSKGDCDQGILLCGTGIGMGIAANKVRGVRAAVCHDTFTVEMSRRHNHANILCLGARVLDDDQIVELVHVWLEAEPEGGRHQRRVDEIMELEQKEP
jgi:ribose 5-phosphate isomerase B